MSSSALPLHFKRQHKTSTLFVNSESSPFDCSCLSVVGECQISLMMTSQSKKGRVAQTYYISQSSLLALWMFPFLMALWGIHDVAFSVFELAKDIDQMFKAINKKANQEH